MPESSSVMLANRHPGRRIRDFSSVAPAPRKNMLSVLHAKLCGAERLEQNVGPTEAQHAIDRCIKRIARALEAYHGRRITFAADEFTALFDIPLNAFQAACEIQERIADLPPISGISLKCRVGLHFGPVSEAATVQSEGISGATRVGQLARGGQILITEDLAEQLTPSHRANMQMVEVPGARDSCMLEIAWTDTSSIGMRTVGKPLGPRSNLLVRHGNLEFQLDKTRNILTIGRDQDNDITISDRRASRRHARIERRGKGFLLIDQSTNGTFLVMSDEQEVALKQQEAILQGKGCFCFGHSLSGDPEDIIEFEVQDAT